MIQALTVAGMFGLFFLGSLYLEKVLGYDPLEIGLAFLPTTLIMGVLSFRYTEPLITRFGARRALLTGLALWPSDCSCSPRRQWTAATWRTSCRHWSCSASASASPSRR